MAKREVVWTELAEEDFLETLEYYFERNGNIKFSEQINSDVNHVIELISENEFIGKTTDIEGVRFLRKIIFRFFTD